MNQITIPFGNEGMKQYRHEFEATGVKLDTYLLDKAISEMEKAGFSASKIGRIIFEEALDYESTAQAQLVIKYLKIHKIPKTVKIQITRGHKEYDE